VTRRTVLPSHDDVQLAIKRLTETTGKPPTVQQLHAATKITHINARSLG
jgi:hypothetical protein